MKKKFLLLVATFGVAITAASFNLGGRHVSATVTGANTLVSATYSSGATTVASGVGTDSGYVSGDGRFVTFTSGGNNAVPSDTNNRADAFVRNVSTSTTTRVSVSTSGAQADGDSSASAISETGRYVLFTSRASNLISGVTVPTTYSQLYLRDTIANTTTLLSQNSSGVVADKGIIGDGVSSDGRFVLFETDATNLGPSVTNTNTVNLYMLDRSTSTFTILNYKYDGTLPNNTTWAPVASMSCDGSFVVFQSGATLTTTSSNHVNTYLLDRRAGSQLTNLTAAGNGAALYPHISCNGNYIGFATWSTNLDPAFTNGFYHPFVYDRINGTFAGVDQTSAGVQSNSGLGSNYIFTSHYMALADNGVIVFINGGTNLTSISTTGTNVYVRDIKSGITELFSQNSSGVSGNNTSSWVGVSSDGSTGTYISYATNLFSGSDANGAPDTFAAPTGY